MGDNPGEKALRLRRPGRDFWQKRRSEWRADGSQEVYPQILSTVAA